MTTSHATTLPTLRSSLGRSPLLRPSAWPRWAREPLVHFVVVGALIFAVDHLLHADEAHTIVVDAKVDNDARRVFHAARGREPNADELYALRRVWLDNEVLYREGLALQVDKGDDAIRERVIFKALSVVDAGTKLPRLDDRTLRDWFEARRDKYDEPARFDFQEAVLAGDSGEAAVREFAAALNAGTPGDAKAGLRVFKGRPQANLVQGYGDDFVHALQAQPLGTWHEIRTKDGWRAMRLDGATPARPAVYESVRTRDSGLDRRDARRPALGGREVARAEVHGEGGRGSRPMSRFVRWLTASLIVGLLGVVVAPASAHEMTMAEMQLRESAPGQFGMAWMPSEQARRGRRPEAALAGRLRRQEALLRCGTGRPAGASWHRRRRQALLGRPREDHLAGRPEARLHAHRGAAERPSLRLGRRSPRQRRDRLRVPRARRRAHPERHRPPALRDRAALPRRLPAAPVLDHHRLHRRAQPHAGERGDGMADAEVGAGRGRIALSIVLVAAEALRRRETLARRWPALVAFLFGLVHGLGFAGALKEIGLPRTICRRLLTFNVGVEIGQLMTVGAAWLVWRGVRAGRPRHAGAPRRCTASARWPRRGRGRAWPRSWADATRRKIDGRSHRAVPDPVPASSGHAAAHAGRPARRGVRRLGRAGQQRVGRTSRTRRCCGRRTTRCSSRPAR